MTITPEKLNSVAAFFSNYVGMTHSTEGVRMCFGESPDGSDETVVMRNAVYMPYATFLAFAKLVFTTQAALEQHQRGQSNKKPIKKGS